MAAIGAPLLTWKAARSLAQGRATLLPCTRSWANWSWDVQKVRTLGPEGLHAGEGGVGVEEPAAEDLAHDGHEARAADRPDLREATLPLYSGFQRSSQPVGRS